VGIIIGNTLLSSAIGIIVGICIGIFYEHKKKNKYFTTEKKYDERSKDTGSTPFYEEVQELKSREKIPLSKNLAYEQVSTPKWHPSNNKTFVF